MYCPELQYCLICSVWSIFCVTEYSQLESNVGIQCSSDRCCIFQEYDVHGHNWYITRIECNWFIFTVTEFDVHVRYSRWTKLLHMFHLPCHRSCCWYIHFQDMESNVNTLSSVPWNSLHKHHLPVVGIRCIALYSGKVRSCDHVGTSHNSKSWLSGLSRYHHTIPLDWVNTIPREVVWGTSDSSRLHQR